MIKLKYPGVYSPIHFVFRVSVGTEHIDDIIADFVQSFAAAAGVKTEGGRPENATETDNAETDAKLVV